MAEELVFTPNDKRKSMGIINGIIWLVVLGSVWKSIVTLDWIVILITFAILGAVSGSTFLALQGAARKKFLLGSGQLTAIDGKKSETLPYTDIKQLEERKVHVGRTSYIAFFAITNDGRELMLFTEGLLQDQDHLLRILAERTGKVWIKTEK